MIFTDPRGYALAINKAWLWQWRGGQTTTEWLAPGMDERPSDWLWVWIAGVEKPHVLHRHNGGDELERALIQRHGSRDQVEAMLFPRSAEGKRPRVLCGGDHCSQLWNLPCDDPGHRRAKSPPERP